jgi:hypothetical protein
MIKQSDCNTSLICASIFSAASMISPDTIGRWGCLALATVWSVLWLAQVLCCDKEKAVSQ